MALSVHALSPPEASALPGSDEGRFGALLGPNEILALAGLVQEDERTTLTRWALAQHAQGRLRRNPHDPGAYACEFCASDGRANRPQDLQARRGQVPRELVWRPEGRAEVALLPPLALRIRDRVAAALGLEDFGDDPYKGSFISVIQTGGEVHQHRDERLILNGEDRPILRCNLFLQRPLSGGDPFFDGRLRLELAAGDLWAFYPTELVHSATPVQGPDCRVLLSMGFLGHECFWGARQFFLNASLVESLEGLIAADQDAEAGAVVLGSGLAPSLLAAGVPEHTIRLLQFALQQGSAGFRLDAAAAALSLPLPRTVEVAAELQRSRTLLSASSRRWAAGRVWIL